MPKQFFFAKLCRQRARKKYENIPVAIFSVHYQRFVFQPIILAKETNVFHVYAVEKEWFWKTVSIQHLKSLLAFGVSDREPQYIYGSIGYRKPIFLFRGVISHQQIIIFSQDWLLDKCRCKTTIFMQSYHWPDEKAKFDYLPSCSKGYV